MPDIGASIASLEKQNLEKDAFLEKKDELIRDYSIKSERIHSINQLLKAAALRAFPAEQVAALHGQDWQDFLLKTCKNLPTDGLADLDSLYAAHPPAATEPLLFMAEYWVRRHEVSDA